MLFIDCNDLPIDEIAKLTEGRETDQQSQSLDF